MITEDRIMFFDQSGPMITYNAKEEILSVSDMNPEQCIEWIMRRSELFVIGMRMIRIAIFGR